MVNIFRRFQKSLLAILTFLVIVSFVIMYAGPGSRLQRMNSDSVGTLYGRDISSLEYRNVMIQFDVLRTLGMIDVVIHLAQNARSMQDAMDNYVWNTLVLRHEADALGILPSDSQILEAIQQIPAFQTRGQFDNTRQTQFLEMYLRPRGIDDKRFEQIVADSLRLKAVRNALAASYTPAPDEIDTAYRQQYQKIQTGLLRFAKADMEKTIQISDEDLKKEYDARKETLKTKEKRKVDFVQFPLPTPDKDGKRPEAEAMQKLADRAADFAGAVMEPNAKFEDVAKKFEAEIKSTGFFELGDTVKELGSDPRIAAAAFQLSKDKPSSEAIGSSSGYFIFHLKDTEAARPLSLEESKEKLTGSLKADRTREALSIKVSEARKKIEESIKSGKSFADAAKEAGLKVESPEPFSRAESKLTGESASLIQNAAADLKDGQLSTPVEGVAETLLIHVEKRLPIDPADVEKQRASITPMLETQRTDGLLAEWIDRQRAAAGLQLAQGR